MERIEYLLNHPTAVEGSDLELLNNEIEKYPYFYSLRALKLSALKKIKDDSFENLLPLTATYSNDRKDLYQYINAKSQNELVQEIMAEMPIVVEENAEVIEKKIQDIDISATDSSTTINESGEIESIETLTKSDEDLITSFKEEITDKEDFLSNTGELVENIINSDVDVIQQENSVEEIIEKHIESDDFNDTSNPNENTSLFGIIEKIDPQDNIVTEPTIESLIEEIKQESQVIDIRDELINFDLPQQEPTPDHEIEKSISIAEDILQHKEIVNEAVKETVEIHQPKQEIEQVSLIARTTDNSSTSENHREKKVVSNLNAFLIQNTFDIVKGSIKPIKTIIAEVKQPNKEVEHNIISNEILEENFEENKFSGIEDFITSENLNEKIPTAVEEITNTNSTVEKSNSDSNSSLSFNDWLRKPVGDGQESTSHKEIKFQIIDEFLEKNPKITPIKKQEIPESKIDVKEIKQTDYSDLMTETLAQIYIEQKQYEKAIKAYKILSLKYPEKNSLFANQIKEIENLKNSK